MHQGEVARRAGVDDRGRPTPAGSAEQLVFTLTILAKPKADVFSNGNPLSSSHASDGLRKTALAAILSVSGAPANPASKA